MPAPASSVSPACLASAARACAARGLVRSTSAVLLALGFALALLACGGGSSADDGAPQGVSTPVATADLTLLMMGNSHTVGGQLPQQLDALVRAGLTGRTVGTAVVPGSMFLDQRLAHAPTLELLRSRRWSVVVLQAQQYSSSGLFTYSTAEAAELVRLARAAGAVPVLFPEWPRRGVAETQRIFDLHVSIAQQAAACVAPIGQAWDLALQRHPELQLHAADGNHSAPAGAYLTALVLYATLTAATPRDLPNLDNGVDPLVQAQLRQAAADTVVAHPPRRHCPLDPPLR